MLLNKLTQEKEIIAWFEIPARDFERAINFYRYALGFKVQMVLLNNKRHGVIRNRYSDARGSIVECDQQDPGRSPLLYFRAPYDVSTTLENIISAGGKISVGKTLIRDAVSDGVTRIPFTMIDNRVGYYAVFTDSEGNRMALYGNN